jgi:S-DNA-T family DNA segregation ATPase FtsK/SpoIIIE
MAKKVAKRKAGDRRRARGIGDKPRVKPERRPFGLFRFLASTAVRRLLMVLAVVALLFWQWDNMEVWATDVVEGTFGLFGWGLILMVVVIVVVAGTIWRRQLAAFARRWKLYQWNKWLGTASFILAIWGILALLDLGGSFGRGIIAYDSGLIGILRVVGLVVLGVILVAPGAFLRFFIRFMLWLVRPFRLPPRLPRPTEEEFQPTLRSQTYIRPATTERVAPPPVIAPPEIQRKERETVTPVTTPAQEQRDLRQVAQEVWKKYGDSPALVTIDGWRLPPIEILDRTPEIEFGQADNRQRAGIIEEALASYGVEAKVVQINAGPTVTQFGVEPGWDRKTKEIRERDRDGNVTVRLEEVSKTRVKVDRITSLSNDLALALAAPSLRIEAPVPGKSVVGIEVPNTVSGMVSLRGVIETAAFQKIVARTKLALALGKGAGGEAVAADLPRMPHLLIAGATGSGKTVCLNSIICCLLLYNAPNELRFIMIDPKRVELTLFNSIPHLATPVIIDANKALKTLRWLGQEMDRRYQKLAAGGVRNIEAYNKKKSGDERLPYLLLIIDELADLMMAGFDEVEHILCRLAQLARATGIHLVVATQRPSVDVITGLIKANFPTRISFAVTSQVDSRTILDMGGAEKLLGRGDMLYMPTEAAKPKRLQGCFVSDAETERLVYFWNSQQKEEPARLEIEELVPSAAFPTRRGEYPEDPLLDAARQLAEEHKHISTSFLQRKLHIGYPRAARLMEQLEEEVSKEEG